MKKNENPAVKATIRDFADRIRDEGLSPAMQEIHIAIAVERLRDEHGISIAEERLASMVG
jgi:hypothetical protein